jgi:hypothetical protein
VCVDEIPTFQVLERDPVPGPARTLGNPGNL